MRFMSIVRATKDSEAGLPPDAALMTAIGKLVQETPDGLIVGMGGLAPSATGARVKAAGGKITVVDGPFAEIKELIAGYAILEVESIEEAIEQARRFMQVHLDTLGPSYEGECEVRQLFGGQDCE